MAARSRTSGARRQTPTVRSNDGRRSSFVAPYMIGLIMQNIGSYRLALAALGMQSVMGAVLLFVWVAGRPRIAGTSRMKSNITRKARTAQSRRPGSGRQLAMISIILAIGATAAPARDAVDGGFLDKYCVKCHNQDDWKGGLSLDYADMGKVGSDASMWENVVNRLRTGMMPPSGETRPAPRQLDAFATWLEGQLDRAAADNPHSGAPGLRRLTRFEYGNAIRDLLSLKADVGTLLPPDNNSDGFDTNGDTLGNSPSLVEAYVNAASKLARRAVGDRHIALKQVDYRPPVGWSQRARIDGMPFNSRGGFSFEREFPLDGEYEFVVTPAIGPLFYRGLPRGANMYLAIDGKAALAVPGAPAAPATPNGPAPGQKYRAQVKAGMHKVSATLIEQVRVTGTDDIYSIDKATGAIGTVSVIGPLQPTGAGDTPARRKVFICKPLQPSDEESCARRILANLATQAYRQPLTQNDAAVEALLGFYQAARSAGGDFEAGIEQALARVLINPRFLFRLEHEPAGLAPGAEFRISDLELASRLSFFLWSSIPDQPLLDLAAAGRLHEPRVLEAQVKRMLADARADALVDNFGAQWLRLGNIGSIPVDERFDENLRQAMLRETRMLLASVIREDRPLDELLDANYTFVDEQLARHYGLTGVKGSYMRRVALKPGDARRGLLGQGSILTLTSLPDRTSPVVRGKWVVENLIGARVPTPPPGVETNLDPPPGQVNKMTLRQRLEAHRVQADCAACHRIMDPIGFALENFDRTGGWRTLDNGLPIDSQGKLTDGTALQGPANLRAWLDDHPDVFATNVATKLFIYALGRSVDYRDMPMVRDTVRRAARRDYRFSELIQGIVQSRAFQFREAPSAPAGAERPLPRTANR